MCKELIYLVSFILVLATGSTAQAGILKWEAAVSDADPIHWYKFDEATGTNCFDYGSEDLDGTYDGVLLGQEGFFGAGTAVRFDRSAANVVNFTGALKWGQGAKDIGGEVKAKRAIKRCR